MLRDKNRDWLVSLSLANLLLIGQYYYLVFQPANTFYLPDLTVAGCASVLVALAALQVSFWLMLRLARSAGSPRALDWAHLAMAFALLVAIRRVRYFLLPQFKSMLLWGSVGDWGSVGAWAKPLALGLLAIYVWHRFTKPFVVGLRVVLSLLAFLPVLHLGNLGYLAWTESRPITSPRHPAAHPTDPTRSHRLVWILFDEMDYFYAFELKPRPASLPEFDRLRAESIFAENAYPPADATKASIPAYLTGKLVSRSIAKNRNDLALSFCGEDREVSWMTPPNLFSTLQEKGIPTGLVGWMLPYCRAFGHLTNECHSAPYFETARSALGKRSLLGGIATIGRDLVFPGANDVRAHQFTWKELQKYAQELVQRPDLPFVYLHLPLPHGPELGVGPDSGKTRTTEETLAQNYRLANRSLALLRKSLENANLWQQTTLLVTSDHFGRHYETERKKAGQRPHYRIPFLLKLAGEPQPLVYAPAFNTIITHDLLLELIDGKLKSAPEVASWLSAHRDTRTPQPQPIKGETAFEPWACESHIEER